MPGEVGVNVVPEGVVGAGGAAVVVVFVVVAGVVAGVVAVVVSAPLLRALSKAAPESVDHRDNFQLPPQLEVDGPPLQGVLHPEAGCSAPWPTVSELPHLSSD